MNKLIIILFAVSLLFGCSPVRTRDYGKNRPTSKEAADYAKNRSNAGIDNDKNNTAEALKIKRFSDTTFVYLGQYNPPQKVVTSKKEINLPLRKAIDMFEEGKTLEACEQIVKILSTLSKDSEDYPETLFYTSECYIVKNQFEPARKILEDLLRNKDLSGDIKEKTLVRLGQIYCVMKDFEKADEVFYDLEKEFPQSIYLPVANCDVIDKN